MRTLYRLFVIQLLLLVVIPSFAKKETVLFTDGFKDARRRKNQHNIGNFICFDMDLNEKQQPNMKWLQSWGIWTCIGSDQERSNCLLFVPNRQRNDDWAISSEIDLTGISKPYMEFDYCSRWGIDSVNEFYVLISIDFTGDVQSATWKELPFTTFHKLFETKRQYVSLKKYVGKKVHIAFRVKTDGKDAKMVHMTRNYFISNVKIAAKK
ncbi:choice-of-anchor J domain-containing protein [Prolixibacteraceae bacterium]|nr:choice-of-anchor J domain-containing protein [Prolixibacteraceae bacterium]